MDVPFLLAEFSSRDVSRIRGACAEVMSSWDREALVALAAHIPEITAATEGIEWGGILLSNAEHLRTAIHRMEHAVKRAACFCEIYTMFANPEREQERGNVTINKILREERACEVSCNRCGATYQVEENDYHYTWWKWVRLAE